MSVTTGNNEIGSLVPKQLVDEWSRIAILEFQKALDKKKIGVTGKLFNSFKRALEMSGGDVRATIIKFLMYGRFRDMGVGNGVKAYERKTNKANLIAAKRYGANVSYKSRQPKRWYNKPKVSQTLRLQELLVEEMGDKIGNWIASEFGGELTISV